MPPSLAFGLGLAVDGRIPRLGGAPPAARTDVRVTLGVIPAWAQAAEPVARHYTSAHCDERGEPLLRVEALANGWWRLRYSDGIVFLVDDAGRELFVTWPEGMSVDDMSSYLLGPVMGFLLRLRGTVSLHASAVAAAGRAFALVGDPGAGKSTTAAAFAARRYPLLADDVTPLAERDGGFDAIPGYPRLRLWPSAVDSLSSFTTAVPPLPAGWQGQRFHLDASTGGFTFQTQPVPLGAIYVLDERIDVPDAMIEPIEGREVLLTLVRHSFAGRLLTRAMRARDLDVLGRVADSTPVRRVRPSSDPRRLPSLCDAILEDFLRLPVPNALSGCVA
jgi:hypothetical protein